MFYTFEQKNIFGIFLGPVYISVECESIDQANSIAQDNGIYFNGRATGRDCHCCGNRWDSASIDGFKEAPLVYDKPIDKCGRAYKVIYLDGSVTIGEDSEKY